MEGWHSSVFTCVFFPLAVRFMLGMEQPDLKIFIFEEYRRRLGQILQTSLYFAARLSLYLYDVLVRDGG